MTVSSAPAAAGDGLIAVDIGGTTIKAVALDGTGRVHGRLRVPTPAGGEAILDALNDAVDELAATLAANGAVLARLGVACPGLVDAKHGIVQFASNLDWHEVELGVRLRERFGVEAAVENDARAGALAEHAWAGLGAADDLAFVPVGTGVSAAYFVDGSLVHGATNAAGEFGHLRAVVDGEPCTCGNRGCVEVYTSAANVLGRYLRAGGTVTSTPAIVAALETDPIAREVWAEATDALTAGLVSLVTLLDPSRIVIGGGLSLAGEALMAPLRTRFGSELGWRTVPRIDRSTLAPHSTLVGAAILGWGAGAPARQDFARRLGAELHGHESIAQP